MRVAIPQEAINKALKALASHKPKIPSGPSELQQNAAYNIWRLMNHAGPAMNMESDPRYRQNMLGSEFSNPFTNRTSPMKHIRTALDMANTASAKRVAADNTPKPLMAPNKRGK